VRGETDEIFLGSVSVGENKARSLVLVSDCFPGYDEVFEMPKQGFGDVVCLKEEGKERKVDEEMDTPPS
jgi:hypothetical protein